MVQDIVNRYWNVLLVVGSVSMGVILPSLGPYLQPLVTLFVIFLVFSSLQGLRLAEIEVESYVVLVLISLCISYVVLPIGGIQIAENFLSDGGVIGFAILLSAPTTAGSAIIWTQLSRGDVQLATSISIISLLVSPVATPIILTQLIGSRVGVPVFSILADLMVILGGGILLAVSIPSNTVPSRMIDRGATLAILLLIYTSVAAVELTEVVGGHLLTVVGLSVFLVTSGLLATILCEHVLDLPRTQTLPLFFASSFKNLGIALLIALPFADSFAVFSIIIYYVVQQLFGAGITDAIST